MDLREVFWPCRMNFHPEHGYVIFASLQERDTQFELVHNLPFEESYRVLTSHEIKELGPNIEIDLDYLTLIKICNPDTETSRTLRAKFLVGFIKYLAENEIFMPKIEERGIRSYLMSCPSKYYGFGFYDFRSFEIFWKRYSYSLKLKKFLIQQGLSMEEAEKYYFTHERGKKLSVSQFVRSAASRFFDRTLEPKFFFQNWNNPYIHDNFVELSLLE